MRQATTAKSLISRRDLIHPVTQLRMILISGDAAALVKGRPPLQVFLPPTSAFVIISCRCRQSTASPLSFGWRRAAKLLISHVIYDRPTRWSARCLRFPKCFRHRGGDTYTLSFFVFALQQRWNRISLIFLSLGCQSWPSSLQILPSVFQPGSCAQLYLASPGINTVAPSVVWLSDVLSLLSTPPPPPPVCVRRCVRAAPKPQ